MSTTALVLNVLIIAWVLYLLINGDMPKYVALVTSGGVKTTTEDK